MGCILDNWNIARTTKKHNGVHVRRMSTHVTDDDCDEILFKLIRKIVEISPVAYTDLTKNWNTFRVDYR